MKTKPSTPVVLYWHRTDLRLHDSPALHSALRLNPSIFIPIWTWDPHYVYRARVGPNRWNFLLQCQNDLSASYTKLNPKQKLWVVREAPHTVLPKLWKRWAVTHLVFEKDTDAYARERDETVMELAKEAGVQVIVEMGRNLFDPDEVVKRNGGKPTMSMSQIEKAVGGINSGRPGGVVETPERVPDPWDQERMDLSAVEQEGVDSTGDVNREYRMKEDAQYVKIMGPGEDFGVPTLDEIGIGSAQVSTPHKGGETEALRILEGCIQDEEYVGRFEKPKTSPAAFQPQSTTLLSPHLHFGSLSVRKFWWDVQGVLEDRAKRKKPNASIPTNLPGQLLFRDMYFAAQAAIGHAFSRTYGNKIVRFIDWHLQSTDIATSGKKQPGEKTYTVDSEEAEIWFHRWKEGRTGFPWIDALMRQLKQEGWIHHLGRHSVACFLTRGGCYVSWERGAEVFQEWLIDHEEACNIGNWMWLSCTAFFAQFYRCYSPVAFGKKWDPEGELVRHYVPELAKFDKKYIYEPWKAPIADQKKWGCRVTGDGSQSESDGMKAYPKPMFDFDERRQTCLDSMKHAYDVGLHGDDARVKDGSWREDFEGDENELGNDVEYIS
ncbi:putative DNA photolyase [Aspergillus steynii IBT 23096]|uniref:Putative DNA photolyase n=1 Tax=Aspergillus steynii IBT 23096 TaxID=1392250 RepID=A0A2I2G485_9EURO|nr:putative DNA photolyase [Aspergillus steynii IBT 23096]PLB47696.1 putative DNA photolyase [Aspergillus steynii IBT 23096]